MAVLELVQCPAVASIPGKVSGAWVFKGTYLARGHGHREPQGGVGVCPDHDCFPVAREGWSALDVEVHTDPAGVCKYVPARILKSATLTS